MICVRVCETESDGERTVHARKKGRKKMKWYLTWSSLMMRTTGAVSSRVSLWISASCHLRRKIFYPLSWSESQSVASVWSSVRRKT